MSVIPTEPDVILALTAIGEASGEGYNGMQAVVNVVMTRAANPGWWGHDPASVCMAKDQFSCWLAGPDLDRMLAMSAADQTYRSALTLARLALAGLLPDLTNGADSYYSEVIGEPDWAKVETSRFTCQIGHHRFFQTQRHLTPAVAEAPVAPTIIEAPIPIPISETTPSV